MEYGAAFSGQVNGLLGAGVPGALVLVTGTACGDVGLRIVVHESEPPIGAEWEDVVEASFAPAGPEVNVAGPMSNVVCVMELSPGDYRARWSGRGMDEAYDLTVGPDEPLVDVFELAFWPAPPAPDAVLRRDSRCGYQAHLPLTPEGRAELQLLEWGGGPPIPELVGRAHGNFVAQLDRSLAEALISASPAARRRVALWAVRTECAKAGTDRLDWVEAGIAALEAGRLLPPEFANWDLIRERLRADLGDISDIGYGGLVRIVEFPPDPLDAALVGIVSACGHRDRREQQKLLDQAHAVLAADRP